MSEGISVAAIRAFYETHVKGKMADDCTTADMLSLVKSITKAQGGAGGGLSYCQLLRQQAAAAAATTTASPPSSSSPSDEVGAATVFISHAWKYNFLAFLVALEARFKDQSGVRLWIDIFCHNQHDELTSDEWITQFEQHIVRISNTVMIVFPWRNPIPFTRLGHTLLPATSSTYLQYMMTHPPLPLSLFPSAIGRGVCWKCSTTRRTECPSRCT
jgi:hypothetical protein